MKEQAFLSLKKYNDDIINLKMNPYDAVSILVLKWRTKKGKLGPVVFNEVDKELQEFYEDEYPGMKSLTKKEINEYFKSS